MGSPFFFRMPCTSPARGVQQYSTLFPGTENPISEGGRWENDALDWTNVATAGGIAFGTMSGYTPGGPYNDSFALLTGSWGPNTEVLCTIFKGTTSGIQEVEQLFRGNSAPHSAILIETNIAHDGAYADAGYWHGPSTTNPADFTTFFPGAKPSVPGGVANGDLWRTRLVGTSMISEINHGSGWLTIYNITIVGGGPATGAPGIGFFKTSGSGANNQFGFTDFTVTEL